MLDRETGSEKGIGNRVKTAFVNHVALRTANRAGKSGMLKAGVVDHTRQPEEKFLPFVWLAIRSGMFDLLGRGPYVKTPGK